MEDDEIRDPMDARSGLASEPAPPQAMRLSFKISARASEAAGNQVQWRLG